MRAINKAGSSVPSKASEPVVMGDHDEARRKIGGYRLERFYISKKLPSDAKAARKRTTLKAPEQFGYY